MAERAFDRVKAARANNRPTGLDYIGNIFSGFFELHGDRRFADDPAIVGGIALLNDKPVTVIAIEKCPGVRSVSPPASTIPNARCAAPSPSAKRAIQSRVGASGNESAMR